MLFGRVSRIFIDIVGTFIVILILGVGLLSWRLSLGPLSLNFMTPLIERALSDQNTTLTVKDTVLTWAGWRRNFDIRIRDVRMLTRDGRPTLEVPEVAIGLSPRALLLHGLIAPTSLSAVGAHVVIVRTADGTWQFRGPGAGQESPSALPVIFKELLAPPNPDSSLGYLLTASVVDSAVTILDEATGHTFAARDAQLIVRRDHVGLRAQVSAVLDLGGKPATVSAVGHYVSATGKLDLAADFAKLDPVAVAAAAPELSALGGFDVPLSGHVDLEFDPQFRLAQAGVHVTGESGRLVAAAYDLPKDTPVRHFRLQGRLSNGLTEIEISDAEVDLGGPTVSLHGRMTGLDAHPHAAATVMARNVSADDMRRLWPVSAATHAREWITENIVRATVGEAQMQVAAGAAALDARWEIENVSGSFSVADAEVNYLTPMPHVVGVNGEGKFNRSRVDITTSGGEVGQLRLGDSAIALTALDTDNETAELHVSINGPLRDALELLDGPPFGYLQKIGLKPSDFSGDMTDQLNLTLPLKKDLKTDQLDLGDTAEIHHLTDQHAALGQDVTDGDVQLRVDKTGLDLAGRVTLGPLSADVELRRNFSIQAPILSRTRARARVARAADLAALGFDVSSYVQGPTRLAVDYVERKGGRSDVTLDATLDDAALTIGELDWHKPAGTPAAAHALVNLAGGRATDVPNFSISSGDPASGGLVARGRAALAADGRTLARLDIDALKAGLTDIHGTVVRSEAGMSVDIGGSTFNAGPFLKSDTTPAGPNRLPLALDIEVDRLYFDSDRWLAHFRFRGRRGRERWDSADLTSETIDESNRPRAATVALQMFEGGRQTLDAVVEDAGAFLKDVGVTPNVIGGRLEVHGATDQARAGKPVIGHLHMTSYRVLRAPILARVLSVALLTGVLDTLTGRGIRFAQLDADFAYFGSRIEISDAHSAGSALGVTASGAIDIDADTIELSGTIVPANAINSLPGKIPFIGNLLTGGGGGLFAATYQLSGSLSEPKVSVNPLATLAPGFLRNLFGVMSGTSATDSTPESEKEIERQQPTPPAAATDPATPP